VSTQQTRFIEVDVSGAVAQFRLLDRIAPTTSAALYESLPFEGDLTHARWAGSACWTKTSAAALAAIDGLENPVTSLYRGTLAIRPTDSGRTELFISYGQAESRHEVGRTYVTPVAQIETGAEGFFAALAETWKGGSSPIKIRQVEEER